MSCKTSGTLYNLVDFHRFRWFTLCVHFSSNLYGNEDAYYVYFTSTIITRCFTHFRSLSCFLSSSLSCPRVRLIWEGVACRVLHDQPYVNSLPSAVRPPIYVRKPEDQLSNWRVLLPDNAPCQPDFTLLSINSCFFFVPRADRQNRPSQVNHTVFLSFSPVFLGYVRKSFAFVMFS